MVHLKNKNINTNERTQITFLHLSLIISKFIPIFKQTTHNWNLQTYILVYYELVREHILLIKCTLLAKNDSTR